MIEEDYKRCTGCENLYPATTEYFHIDKRVKSGLRSKCKSCYYKSHKENTKKWRENNKT